METEKTIYTLVSLVITLFLLLYVKYNNKISSGSKSKLTEIEKGFIDFIHKKAKEQNIPANQADVVFNFFVKNHEEFVISYAYETRNYFFSNNLEKMYRVATKTYTN
ncbi:hypothetical protein A3J61_01030 [Candidatus Nomurabacteria bacterium RIFCSPHIGHO2_02_FULL_38_15]|uniref:Uncharacterized protein n=1 Tax=Candidatus Nomurabacteria bacterium RIFCSPHIGHO2_02_FULL_38_15 TaxID=1801752 RepID=A0A1F6VS93_9BACT|nr:MAG: hypothetical protein A3J61_01030 [Candidatus Nomurabacteria bacterium RIFCSPHIGHO2_02_FULL_38_15]